MTVGQPIQTPVRKQGLITQLGTTRYIAILYFQLPLALAKGHLSQVLCVLCVFTFEISVLKKRQTQRPQRADTKFATDR